MHKKNPEQKTFVEKNNYNIYIRADNKRSFTSYAKPDK